MLYGSEQNLDWLKLFQTQNEGPIVCTLNSTSTLLVSETTREQYRCHGNCDIFNIEIYNDSVLNQAVLNTLKSYIASETV